MQSIANITIKTQKEDIILKAGTDRTLLDLLREAEIDFYAPCGGNGTCGKCKIKAQGALSGLTDKERAVLSAQEIADGIRLACLCKPAGDATLWPQKRGASVIKTEGGLVNAKLNPSVHRVAFFPEKAGLERQVSMAQRVTEALAAAGQKVGYIEPECLAALPAVLEEHREKLYAVLDGERLLEVSDRELPVLGIAVDIGTTTVVAYLYDLVSGEQLGVKSELSAQKAFGSDVISRIKCATEEGLEPLQDAIVTQINQLAQAVCADRGVDRVMRFSVCGNPTMQHILCGFSPKTIAAAPFVTVSGFGFTAPARAFGLRAHSAAGLYVLPLISGYVGGDITAGVIACGMDHGDEVRLLLDIGTNGEMALSTPAGIYYCATAAGPAFEGAHIEDGVGGITGAVSSVRVEDGKIAVRTIADAPAIGICGSGIIDAVAALLEVGAMDETGRLCDADEFDAPYNAMLDEDAGKFILDPAAGIGLTGRDLREVQLAKAAIAAGIQTLLHHAGLTEADVREVYLAGGFGSYISKESSCRIGLLPPSLLERIRAVGNSAGKGAILALLDHDFEAKLAALPESGHYIELSAYPFFNDSYIENMMF